MSLSIQQMITDVPVRNAIVVTAPSVCVKENTVLSSLRLWIITLPSAKPTPTTSTTGECAIQVMLELNEGN